MCIRDRANPYQSSRSGSVRVTPSDSGIPNVTVTVTQEEAPPGTLSVTPEEGLVSSGPEGGPFEPSSLPYTLQNVGTTWLEWRASKTQDWTDLSSTSGYLAPGASRTVTVSINAEAEGLAPGTYGDTVSFTNRTNGRGNTTRPVSLTVTAAAGALAVTPVTGLTSTGPAGGPFSPESQAYTLENTGRTSLDWTAANTQSWTTLSAAAGTLAPRESTTVTVSINAGADLLPAGEYGDTITFTNTTSGSGTTSRAVTLTVTAPPGVLAVSPAEGLASAGPEGGPFTPDSRTYTLENTGGTAIDWTASNTQAWTTLSATSGTLEAGATAAVTVSLNAAAAGLAVGDHSDTVSFTNTTNGNGDTSRAVTLTVTSGPTLIVIPAGRSVAFTAGTTTFEVSNTGGGTMAWTAAAVSGAEWLTIQSGASGIDGGTIVVAFEANPSDAPRAGSIRVTAPGAAGSPRDVTVTQAGSSFGLALSGQRLVEKAWIIQREYARLTVTVDNPASVPVESYVITRRAEGGPEEPVQQVAGSAVTTNPWIANDAFLDPATSYTYRIVALDAGGGVLAQSNEITL